MPLNLGIVRKLVNRDKIAFVLVLVMFITTMVIPQSARANEVASLADIKTQLSNPTQVDLLTKRFLEAERKLLPLPIADKRQVDKYPALKKGEMYVVSTAYSSSVDQCDSTPCITANGYNVCESGVENVIAANFLPFGTKVRIPDLFGDRVFIVQDRMNPRYFYRVDLWMTSRDRAIEYGNRYVKIEIVTR